MKKLLFICFVLVACQGGDKSESDMYYFVDELMRKMTIEEKIGQLNLPVSSDLTTGQAKSESLTQKIKDGKVGGLFNIKGVEKIREIQRMAVEDSRLKIPLIFGMDVIHGYETVFPIPLGMAATWNLHVVQLSARIAAIEASADGICWTFSPMVDICRDPRWGRISEGSGEDPYLGGEIAKAMVWGYQGAGEDVFQSNSHIMACVKHYALYGAAEAGRDYNTTDMSRVRMFNEYMYPYQAAIEAGVGSVMASFNEVDGVPVTANKWLLTDVLRNDWRFDGFVVSDYTGISEMIDHGIGNLQTVSARALRAGIDMDMVSEGFLTTINQSLKEGKIDEIQIDRACRRILEAKYKLGLFDDPYKYCDPERAKKEIYTAEHRDIARQVASESFVLLKNEKKTLPISKKAKIAVVGPLANTRTNMPGTWSVAVNLDSTATVVEALKSVVADETQVVYAKGSHLMYDADYEQRATVFGRTLHRELEKRSDKEMLDEALAVARSADVVVAALGESSEMSGESSSRTELGIPDAQQALLKALLTTGKPVVLVLFAGRPLTLTWEDEHVPAILNVWFGGTEAAYAIADVLFGDVNPSGKLPVTFPRNVGQIPLYYNHKNTGRPLKEGGWFEKFRSNYLDVVNEPLYPFGYGLSYTEFEYGDIQLSDSILYSDNSITATVFVSNTGDRAGAEVVQLYIRDLEGSITRPVKELKAFKKIFLNAGESKEVSFIITSHDLKFYNYDLQFAAEPGFFDVIIADSKKTFSLKSDN